MGRLILIALVAIALVFAIKTVMALIARTAPANDAKKADTMPDTFKTVAYVLLIILMFGVTTGWLAG